MKKLFIFNCILIAAVLTGCVKENVTSDPGPLVSNLSSRPTGSPAPSILQWQKCLGASSDDFANAVAKTSDGYFVAGYSTGSNGNQDAVVSKIDMSGNLIWKTTVGGSSSDDAAGVVKTPDGGCLAAGYTYSNDGDVIGKGGGDVLIFKLSASGAKEWVKTIGGSGYDRSFALISTSDGGYALTGNTASMDGDVTNSQVVNGIAIVWLVKFTIATGAPAIDWQKTIGISGTRDDIGYALVQAVTGDGYTIAGRTLTANGPDIWVINTDNAGVKQWDRTIASSGGDVAFGVAASADGYIVTGYLSNDLVVTKLNLDGTNKWQKIFPSGSSTGRMHGRSVISTAQGDIIVGFTNSKNGDIIASQGSDDLFVLRLDDANGNKISSNVFGGKNSDMGKAVIATDDGGYVVVGNTGSNNGDVSGNHGGVDAWVVKFKF